MARPEDKTILAVDDEPDILTVYERSLMPRAIGGEGSGDALREMDAEQWGEARGLLAQIQKMEEGYRETEQLLAQVEADLCASCLICVRSCPYQVPRINEDGVSEIDMALCHGCGVCAAECPAKAIELNWYEDVQIMSKVDALLEGVM